MIANLLSNSRDAIREGKVDQGKIEMTLSSTQDELILDIKDNGPGVPEDIRNKIFSAYFTTKALGHGTGLGLCISEQIIKAHGGVLSCLPRESGAWFQMRLPRPIELNLLN